MPPFGAIIHVGLQLAKHILMLGQPNFNPSCCFLGRKKHLPPSPVISPRISLASFIQSHALAPPPATQALGHRCRRLASIKPTLVQCFVLAVLSYHWTGTMLGQHKCKTVVGRRLQSIRLIKSPHIYIVYCVSP